MTRSGLAIKPGFMTLAAHPHLWVTIPLLIFAASRAISTAIMAWASGAQVATSSIDSSNPPKGYFVFDPQTADPGVLAMSTNWDGQWYQLIATEGYTPRSIDPGPVATYAWNFPPLFPKSVGVLMDVTGLDYAVAATLWSTCMGAIAMVALYRFIEPRVGSVGAAGAVALTSTFVTASLYQSAYTEATAVALLVWSLWCLRARHYYWGLVPLILLAFTRLITPPLAIVAAVLLVSDLRSRSDVTARKVIGCVTYAVVSCLGAFLWPWLAGSLGGLQRQVPPDALANGWFGTFASVGAFYALLPALIAVLIIRITHSERGQWGLETATWAWAYPLFIMAVTPPYGGLIRYFMLAFPLSLAMVGRPGQSARQRWAVILVGCTIHIALQIFWVRYVFVLNVDASRFFLIP